MSSYFDFLKKRGGNGGNTGNESSNSRHINGFNGGYVLPDQQMPPVTSGNTGIEKSFLLPAIPTPKEAVVTVEPNVGADVTAVPGVTTQNDKDINYLYQERAGIFQYDAGLPKAEAERLAYQETLLTYMEETYPKIVATFQNIILNNTGKNT